MKKYFLFLCLLPIILSAQKPIFTTAKVDAVSIYFNSAEMTHSVQTNIPSGTSEIVVKNVSNYVNENTLLVSTPSNITVMSTQFTTDYISEYDKDEKLPELKKLRDSITSVSTELNKLKNEKNSISKTIEMLDANQKVSGTNTGLNITDYTKIIEYYQSKRTQLSNTLLTLDSKEKKLSENLSDLNNRLTYGEKKEEKISKGKLIINVVNSGAAVNTPIKITYVTQGATWQPFYDLRADNVNQPINMLYKAQVTQNTGVDWKKVKLSLVSGSANQSNQIPIITPWFLHFQDYTYNNNKSITTGRVLAKPQVLSEIAVEYDRKVSVSTVASTAIENQLNISFDISILYDIASNGKQHSVVLNEIKIPASYKYFSVPKLDADAYLMAEVKDYSQYNLLPGYANIIFEGTYVGKTYVNANQTSDTLNLSMGKDKRVNIKRERIIDKSNIKFLSSSKEQTFTYDIIVRNNKKEKINITLKDQYPLSTDESIVITLLENSRAKIDKEKGELTWDLSLAPNETKKIRISYKVKAPKDKVIQDL